MIFLYPLKPFERILDRIEKSKLSRRMKSILLTLVTLSMLAQSFGALYLMKLVTDLAGALLGHALP
jgi:hypothetical protein